VYVWGEPYILEIIEHSGYSKISFDNGIMIMRVPRNSARDHFQDVLDRWYRNTLKKSAPVIIEKWEKILGIEIEKLYIRKMKTHWGSCNYVKQTLRLNSELVKRSPECLEYVIIHEMLHIFEKGHNRDFYKLLGKYVPDWKAIRKKMNTEKF